MEIQQLRAWRSLVATGSVRGAADALGYSPSAISQQISQLQKEVGITLLSRVGRGIEPTPAGRALAARVDGVLGELGDLHDFVRALRAGRSATLTFGYFPSLGATWLPDIVGPLVGEFPDTSLDLYVSDTHDPARRPRPDLQLLVLPPGVGTPAGYQSHPVAEDSYVVTMRHDDPLAARDSVPMAELAHHSWIDNEHGHGPCRRIVLDACAAVGFQPAFRIQTHDYPTALALVARGLGLSVMPALGATHLPDGVVRRPIVDPTPTRAIHAIVLRDSADQPVVQRALALTLEAAAAEQPSSLVST
ncbi:LysR family transcriptional regulator [Ornithinicoccus halotolerans]|uniref:LysR family transcriptional regulator n=1 Tax=Ornithinicoccus halotolerans TaxID=1748220 RepID=UPI001295D87D|nr:LysR family transcriptional regulator [Ornithinicoccus halotolerans]